MRIRRICTVAVLALLGAFGSVAAGEHEEEPDLASVEGVVRALYDAVSFPPGGEPDWKTLRRLMMPEAVLGQPVRGSDDVELLTVDEFIGRFRDDLATFEMRETGFDESIARMETTTFGRIAHCLVVFEVRRDPVAAEPLGRGVDSIELVRTGGRWWIAAVTTEHEGAGRPIPAGFDVTVTTGHGAAGGGTMACGKLGFDLDALDENGLIGPPDGKVAVDYEFCIPKDEKAADEVRTIDPTIALHPNARGRVGCGPMEVLCLGSTNQRGFREILERLCQLEYIRRIERTWYE